MLRPSSLKEKAFACRANSNRNTHLIGCRHTRPGWLRRHPHPTVSLRIFKLAVILQFHAVGHTIFASATIPRACKEKVLAQGVYLPVWLALRVRWLVWQRQTRCAERQLSGHSDRPLRRHPGEIEPGTPGRGDESHATTAILRHLDRWVFEGQFYWARHDGTHTAENPFISQFHLRIFRTYRQRVKTLQRTTSDRGVLRAEHTGSDQHSRVGGSRVAGVQRPGLIALPTNDVADSANR